MRWAEGAPPCPTRRKRVNAFVEGLPAGGSALTCASEGGRALKDILMRLGAVCAIVLAAGSTASAQIPFTRLNADPTAANAAFPLQNAFGPSGTNYQVNYPFPGQCLASPANAAMFPTLPACGARAASSFDCVAGVSHRTAGGWAACGAPIPFAVVNPVIPSGVVANAIATPKFAWEVLNPPDYSPDTTTYPGADYYEIGVHEAWGFQVLAGYGTLPGLGGVPNPQVVNPAGPSVPNGMQWTGLLCNTTGGCTCPADATGPFRAQYCSFGGKVPLGAPLFTPVWGVGQINMGGTLGVPVVGASSPWSQNNYVATWPSISIRGTRGRPVVVKWVNEFPDNHVLCPHPDAADWACAIDRTFMGVKATMDPAAANDLSGVGFDGVNPFGSPQQPDNSWVTHLHGGEIPPGTDGFAEKWFGNATTAPKYNDPLKSRLVIPAFENPSGIALTRPAGNSDLYTYPMVQEEATIWFHDHTLGKTHHNVIAGPAGFFPVKEPLKHGKVTAGACAAAAGQTCDYTWLDPVTEPRGAAGAPLYDMLLAIQDRSFNDDGSINLANGNGQPIPAGLIVAPGTTPITPGVNPLVHPLWVPEYFGDHVLVNGVLWPKKTAEPGWYRLRLVDGSDSRCWTLGFQVSALPPAPGANVTFGVPFYILANDQGYMKNPVLAPKNQLTMCPGERYELLVNFGALPGLVAGAPANVWMVNTAPAPFPAGISPQSSRSPYADMNVVMKFQVQGAGGIKSCGINGAPASLTWDPALPAAANLATACMPANPALQTDPSYQDLRPVAWPIAAAPGANIAFRDGKSLKPIVRQVYLNERVDGVTLAPMGMQLNGVPFEYKVTETPKLGTREIWQFVNLTVDAHPMHPHYVKNQIIARQTFNVGAYKALLCGSATCQPGTAPGGEMQVVPDVTPTLTGQPTLVTPLAVDGGYKDAVQAPPGMVTSIVADWIQRYDSSKPANAPGTAGCTAPGCAAPYSYDPVTSGPFVWHCHINSHEDSEMMRTSLVVN